MSDKAPQPRERVDIAAILGPASASTPRDSMRRTLIWGGAAATALGLLAAWLTSGGNSAIAYTTEPVTRGGLVVIVTATGSVQPTNKVDVSSELSGTVRKVLVDYNSVVTAGQKLAELDTDKVQATLDSSRAKLAAARARVDDAEATIVEKRQELSRKRTLAGKQIASKQDLDLAQAAYDRAIAALASAKADVGAAEADVKLNETNFSKSCICSPIDGVVLVRNVDPGQTVAASLQAPVLFSIAENLKQMELQVDVDEADVGKVAIGQKASFSVDAFPERRFPAAIRDVRFASETIQGVVTYKAVLDIDNSELLLRPGMTATAEIRVAEISEALLVPNAALRFTPTSGAGVDDRSFLRRILPGPPPFRPASRNEQTGADRTVWVLENGDPVAIKVVVGVSDGKRSEVRNGALDVGRAVIIEQTSASK